MAKVSQLQGVNLSPATEEKAVKRLTAIYERLKSEEQLNQTILAHRMGLKQQSAISQYFLGKVPLNMIAVVNFAQALNVSPSDIYPELMEPVRTSFLRKIDIPVRYAIIGLPTIKNIQYAQIQEGLEEYGVHLNVADYLPYKTMNSFVVCSNLVKVNKNDEVFIKLNDGTRFVGRFLGDENGITRVIKLQDNEIHEIQNDDIDVCDIVLATQRATDTLELKD